jgi:hypothetical protein
MRPRQREIAKTQNDLEKIVRRLKKLSEVIGELEETVAFESYPLKGTSLTINDNGGVIAIPPCPDEHMCWKCQRVVPVTQKGKET